MSELPFSLIVFTYLSDISAGTFIFYLLYKVFFAKNTNVTNVQHGKGGKVSALFGSLEAKVSVLSLVLLGFGLLSSALHLGHPFRFLNALRNPSSMIAQEAYWSIGFGILLLVVTIFALKGKKVPLSLNVVTAFVGLGLLTVTALAYAKPMGIPAWNQGLTPIIFISSALIMGSVVFMMTLTIQSDNLETVKKMVFIFLGLLFIQVFVELAYSVQLSVGTFGVELPNLLSLNISRWLIGLLAPLAIMFALFKKSLQFKTGIALVFATIIVGEGISRLIFFMNGVHL